ncbi:MAG: DegT/DnrJ/EryC1/StrS family aminotransferase [Chthoniobacterales bacterium]
MTTDSLFPPQPLAEYLADKPAIDAAIERVLMSGRYILGPEVTAFEGEFSAWLGVRETVGVASGTDALVLALKACGIGPGDVVITVSHTAVATVAAIEWVGAIPLLVDIEPGTFTMNAMQVESVLRTDRRVKALLPVHLYGHPCDMAALEKLARAHELKLIEDCSQAHGAKWQGRKVGTWGDVATFSFYPTKNLGAIGDGGAVATNSPDVAQRLRSLRQYGWERRYISENAGGNSRLDELQAAILRVKAARLDAGNARRCRLAEIYMAELNGTRLQLPSVAAEAEPVFHQYVVRAERRTELGQYLEEHGIPTAVLYPVPVHLQPAYAGRIALAAGGLPETERAAAEVLSLPLHPQLSEAAVRRVISLIRDWAQD